MSWFGSWFGGSSGSITAVLGSTSLVVESTSSEVDATNGATIDVQTAATAYAKTGSTST